jgi:pyruvate/2-oxoglutarate dehydrogenase complex dihydrolipoamide dehydrogenase (E3) component
LSLLCRFERDDTGRVRVYTTVEGSEEGEVLSGEYDTVLMAIGRTALAGDLNLKAAGVKYNEKNGGSLLE